MTNPTRRLSDIKFEHEGAHVALVSKHQGGPANGKTTLIMKATHHISPELIEKAGTVTVTLEFTEFLRKFFNMYWDDAEVLARALGFSESDDTDEKSWIDTRVDQINIMKSVYKSQDVLKAVGELDPEVQVALMQTQELLEKAMETTLSVGETLQTQTNGESTLETILKSAHEEFVTKAVGEAVAEIQKSLDAQAEILKAAQAQLETYKAAEAAAVLKSRTDILKGYAVPEEKIEAILKSLEGVDETAFALVTAQYAITKAAVDTSDLLKETGASGDVETDPKAQDETANILKARYAHITK